MSSHLHPQDISPSDQLMDHMIHPEVLEHRHRPEHCATDIPVQPLEHIVGKHYTGRTQRMLMEATRLAGQGRSVIVVWGDANDEIRQRFLTELGDWRSRVTIADYANVSHRINWQTMTLNEGSPDTIVLVDHMHIENRFRGMLQQIRQFSGL